MSEMDEVRRAIQAADEAKARTDAIASTVRSTRDDIRRIVEPNGYVNRFREMMRGNPYADPAAARRPL